MTNPLRGLDRVTTGAMACAGTIGAQYIAGQAARDAFFLAHFEPTALPPMIIGTSIFSIALVVVSSRSLGKIPPGTYLPTALGVSAAVLLASWGLAHALPLVAAPLVYLLVSGAGPMLGSAFWLIASERFDPHEAKRRFGQIGAAGTIGGLIGGAVAARVSAVAGVEALLPLLAVLQAGCAWQTGSWARAPAAPPRREPTAISARSGARALVHKPYLRNLALLVLIGAVAAALADYVFKVQVKASLGGGSALGSFFSFYYAAVSLIVFLVQGLGSRVVLERFGLSAAMSVPSFTLVVGGAAALLAPGLPAIVAVRGGESVFRASLLKAGHELLYTPLAPAEKRAVKAIVDVGVDRSGDIIGASVIQLLLWAAVVNQRATLLMLMMLCALAGLVIAKTLSRGYVKALEESLLDQAVELDLGEVSDRETRTVVLGLLRRSRPTMAAAGTNPSRQTAAADGKGEIAQILVLRSLDVEAVRRALHSDTPLAPALVPHVIRLLEWDLVAEDAIRALRGAAEERVGELIDTLTDPNQPFVVRRRLARVFSVCVSQRAADGLLLGLEDLRFEVRFRCGRSLAAIQARNPRVRIDPHQVIALVHREVAVSRSVWDSRRLLDGDRERSSLDELVSDRANRALTHVFTLLGFVLPAEPLRIAYHGLHTNDTGLRGTALEYLESVLPPEVRDLLWPLLEPGDTPRPVQRSREEIVKDLLRSNQSIVQHLQHLETRRDR